MAKYKFKLMSGTHHTGASRDENGRKQKSTKYVRGDVVESDQRLDKMFVNKFQLIRDDSDAEDFDELDTMTREELIAFAEREEIPVDRRSHRENLIKTIRTAVTA